MKPLIKLAADITPLIDYVKGDPSLKGRRKSK
jgi:hypothetical protein